MTYKKTTDDCVGFEPNKPTLQVKWGNFDSDLKIQNKYPCEYV